MFAEFFKSMIDSIRLFIQEPINDHRRTSQEDSILTQKLTALHQMDQCDDRYDEYCLDVKHLLKPSEIEQLKQIVEEGPVWDGNVISKHYRNNLQVMGLVMPVVVRNEQGYTGATYLGWNVLKAK